MPPKNKNILATGQVTYTSNLPQSSPNMKQKESAQKQKQLDYYKRLKDVNALAKMLSPDGKLYANLQKKAGKLFDMHMKGMERFQNEKLKQKFLKEISSSINKPLSSNKKKNALGGMPNITTKKKAMTNEFAPKKKKNSLSSFTSPFKTSIQPKIKRNKPKNLV